MKKGVLSTLFAAVLVLGYGGVARAQEVEINPCDPQLAEVVAEFCELPDEGPVEETPVDRDVEDKGVPSPETVAGNEELSPQTGVLGASITPQVLAATGVEAWVFVIAGATIITEAVILFSIKKPNA
jgi:hypothetical protein